MKAHARIKQTIAPRWNTIESVEGMAPFVLVIPLFGWNVPERMRYPIQIMITPIWVILCDKILKIVLP